ncbi:MAG: stalk domain-containing protein [Defluviitaleaceae bacterium]|nr:stalk domain-containing protein [Defluviitaleaceae bacterium]
MKFLLSAVFIFLLGTVVYAAPNINAPIAIVMDFYTGEILYERNSQQRWIPASMTKSMTAFITYQEIAEGNLSLDTEIRVSAEAARFSSDTRVSGSFVPLPAGEYITVEVLLQLMMIPSANAAAVVLAEHIAGSEEEFVARMNQTAVELGMYASFNNSHGARVTHSDAYSMAVLVREFILNFPDILRITAMPNMTFRGNFHGNTNHLLHSVPFAGTDGFKTGSLRQSGWNHSTTAVRDGRRVIAVLMNADDNAQRQRESRILLEFGFAEIERREAEIAARVRVFFNGMPVPLSSPAVVQRGQVMLPMRDVFERLGYSVTWHAEHRVVLMENDTNEITLFPDRNVVIINGITHVAEIPAQTINGRIYISKELVALISGTSADRDATTGVIQFRSF